MKALDVVSKLDEVCMQRIEDILQNKPKPEEEFC
jgi:hypothetical protein